MRGRGLGAGRFSGPPRCGSEQRDESRGGGERRSEGSAAERTGVRDADRGVCLGVSTEAPTEMSTGAPTGALTEVSVEVSVEIGVNSPVPFVG